jgi:(1->4)-alpha-D-glucan 1-alpha-D-glucosylmutase
LNSLAQTLIKITSPGIPDFFQGSELWDLSLVDPDNRRPVDFDIRKTFLTEIMKLEGDKNFLMNLMAKPESGKIKLFLSYRALFARRENQSLFEKGDYIPLRAEGTHADRVFGFARRDESSWAITIIPRLLTNLVTEGEYPLGEKVWENTSFTMPEGCPSIWENAITGEKLRVEDRLHVSEVFTSFPVALILAQ